MIKVWTNGCFDVLHRGHIELFKYAKSLGDILIVGIDTDAKIRTDKGKGRPIHTLEDRIEMLNSIKYIDEVLQFNTTNELRNLVRVTLPDIMVVGSDWKNGQVIGREFTKELKFFDRVGDYSTTKIMEAW
ncbi:adenylyltransferase/cytidyltransferase family protein [Candidatus Woesearchaeota archaeon]|nr:adenylyltransferase/cytidyltransferase family protein [Candidatus Woesearchaeota archaeon]MBT4732543.1 adenylyltransferase/cytidyltransferase family protein [Candidatus Woesearchaeota archaeon]MBT7558760.1 adenylyltransferase/cytidyltransferase family protein [Candidatus Woesearchaeota archaeon]